MDIPAVLLGAGASSRLGTPKQLVEFGGETLLGRAIRISSESGATPVFAVLGANRDAIFASVTIEPAIEVYNDAWPLGIASSIHAGMRAVESHLPLADGVLLLTCDQPRLTADHLRCLLSTFKARPGQVILASGYAGALGVPALFPRSLFGELLSLRGDEGARRLLANPAHSVAIVEFPGGEIDIDEPSDLSYLS